MSEIIPFGKYKGRTIQEVQNVDPQYLEWLSAQPWFADRFKAIYNIVVQNFHQQPEETPEHNAMQVKFLDGEYCARLCKSIGFTSEWAVKNEHNVCYECPSSGAALRPRMTAAEMWAFNFDREFEYYGFDVRLEACLTHEYESSGRFHNVCSRRLLIELKPTMGDDYPAVMRQMQAANKMAGSTGWLILIVGEYTGVGATWDQVKAMFKQSGIWASVEHDLEL